MSKKRKAPRRPYGAVAKNTVKEKAPAETRLPNIGWQWRIRLFIGWALPDWWYLYKFRKLEKHHSSVISSQ